MNSTPNHTADDAARKRRVKRNALLLGLLAVGFYVAFIALSMLRAH